jgi:hypothetical protein
LAVQVIGTLQVNVTGLTGSPASGGSAVAQRTDAAGSPVTINISAAGSGTNTNLPVGTYTVSYTPPGGFNVAGGVTNPVTGIAVTAGGTATVAFAVVVATGTGSIAGTVGVQGGTGVPGGVVQLLNASGGVVSSFAVGAGGAYTIPSLAGGAYTLRLQPVHTHCLGPSEPDTRSVNVTGGATSTQDFVVQPAYWYDGFQGYANTAALLDNSSGVGTYVGAAHFLRPAGGPITLDPTGGPDGLKAMRYDWPDRTGVGCTGNEYTLAVEWYKGNGALQWSTLWARWTDKLSAGWHNGDAVNCGSFSYKYLLLELGTTDPVGQIGLFINQDPTSSNDLLLRGNPTVNGSGDPLFEKILSLGPATAWTGVWHTWVLRATGMGTTSGRLTLWLDGTQIIDISGSLRFTGGPEFYSFQFGANINNGPDKAQSRWWREVGVYAARPSMVNGV